MKAYLFSIGESTTDLAQWSLQRQGFEVVLLHDPATTFAEKYRQFLELSRREQWVVRSDADVVVLRRYSVSIQPFVSRPVKDTWWYQYQLFCFLRLDVVNGCPQLIHRKALDVGLRMRFAPKETRPETAFFRSPELLGHTLTVCDVVGIHGYCQQEKDVQRVVEQKKQRGQYDEWDLQFIERLNTFGKL